MPTITDVAERAGVSPATVSRHLSGQRVRRAAEVQAAIDQLGYRPSHTARVLQSGLTNAIGVVVPDVANPYFGAVVKGIESISQESGFNIYLSNTDESEDREREILDDLVGRVDGVILTPAKEHADNTAALREAGVPVVLVDRRVQGRSDLDMVLIDSVGGAKAATQELLRLGHERIGAICGPLDTTPGRERHEGFLAALAEAEIEPEPELIQFGDFKQASGYQAALRLMGLTDPPTAVFAANNLMTMGALQAFHTVGASVPADVSVLGFDDLELAELLVPPLSVISRPTVEQGVLAMRLLRSRLDGGANRSVQTIVLDTRLVCRESCGPPSRPVRQTRRDPVMAQGGTT